MSGNGNFVFSPEGLCPANSSISAFRFSKPEAKIQNNYFNYCLFQKLKKPKHAAERERSSRNESHLNSPITFSDVGGETMSGFDKSDRENDSTHNSDEVRIIGKVSRLYLHGKLLYPVEESEKKKSKQYVIIPVEDKNSFVEYIKVPMYKIKNPESKFMGSVDVQRVNFDGQERSVEKLRLWRADKNSFPLDRKDSATLKKQGEPESAVREFTYELDVNPGVSKSTRKESDPAPRVTQVVVKKKSSVYKVTQERDSGSHRGSVEKKAGSYRESQETRTYYETEERRKGSNRNSLDFLSNRGSVGGQLEETEKIYRGKSKAASSKKEKKNPGLKRKTKRKDEE